MYCHVDVCHNGISGLQLAENNDYDLVNLEQMLPGTDGLEICIKLRAKENYILILMLKAKSTELDRVLGLEIVADDYVTKPFSITVVLARIKTIFCRVDALKNKPKYQPGSVINRGKMKTDLERHTILINHREIDLTAKEFDKLVYFAQQPGRVFPCTTSGSSVGIWP